MSIRIAYIGAGSETFGPPVVDHLFSSDLLLDQGMTLVLMDQKADHLTEITAYATGKAQELPARPSVETTTDLEACLRGADFVLCSIEVERYFYWAQDFHIPRQYGFNQVYGENGEIGGLFHALRNMTPMLEIARAIERICPDAVLLNFSNPEHKLCEAITRLTSVRTVGLCPGVYIGRQQIADILERPVDSLDTAACGINHFTWFQSIRDGASGEDLYPELRRREAKGDELSHWHEIGLGRILFRRYGLWPSPGANHYAEYLHWAKAFVAHNMQYYYDPALGSPWDGAPSPEFVYSIERVSPERPWIRQPKQKVHGEDEGIDVDAIGAGMAVMIMEGLTTDVSRALFSVNVPNRGSIPGLEADTVVEVPATVTRDGIEPHRMEPLPEAITATLRLHGSIHKLLVEAFETRSRDTLLQAVLLDPTANDYLRAVEMVNAFLRIQEERLPAFV